LGEVVAVAGGSVGLGVVGGVDEAGGRDLGRPEGSGVDVEGNVLGKLVEIEFRVAEAGGGSGRGGLGGRLGVLLGTSLSPPACPC